MDHRRQKTKTQHAQRCRVNVLFASCQTTTNIYSCTLAEQSFVVTQSLACFRGTTAVDDYSKSKVQLDRKATLSVTFQDSFCLDLNCMANKLPRRNWINA